MSETLSLVLVGFGSVNRAFARLVASEAKQLEHEHGLKIVYRAIVARHGAWDSSVPLEPSLVAQLADDVAAGITRLDGSTPPPKEGIRTLSKPTTEQACEIIQRQQMCTGCLVEAIDVDYDAGEPAVTLLATALRAGMHAVSANKGPVVHQRSMLLSLAHTAGVRYLHESAVMDGVPLFSAWRGGWRPGGARLKSFRGALNSTTSVVLSGMERGQSMMEALRTAQDAGIAEADPKGDLSGMDAAVKVVALAVALELSPLPFGLGNVDISGIEAVTPEDVAAALAEGCKLRLVGGAEIVDGEGGKARGYVRVEKLAPGDPLHGLDGADAAVTFCTDKLSPVTIVQKGGVVEDTAFGLFADMMRACRPSPP